jgi:hypothetical protein
MNLTRIFTYEHVYVHLLFQAYPYLKKRAEENPEPPLVDLVKKIETLIKIESGELNELTT